MADKPYPEDLQRLLTQLRKELNLLNTLNCNVHLYQGDFSIDRAEADRRTEANLSLYMAQLRAKVTPLFVELGKLLVDSEVLRAAEPMAGGFVIAGDADYASVARRWYQRTYETGVCW